MLIKADIKPVSHKSNCNNKKINRPIIIIPKKNVKLANKRNKIRRQIRAIIHDTGLVFDKKILIKYLDKNIVPDYKELKKTILTILSINKIM